MLISARGDITTILLDNGADIEARSRKGQPKNLCLNFEEIIVERNYYTYDTYIQIIFTSQQSVSFAHWYSNKTPLL